jgi:hypothetical protein
VIINLFTSNVNDYLCLVAAEKVYNLICASLSDQTGLLGPLRSLEKATHLYAVGRKRSYTKQRHSSPESFFVNSPQELVFWTALIVSIRNMTLSFLR